MKIIKRYPNGYEFEDDLGTRWWYWEDNQGVPRLWKYDPEDAHHEHGIARHKKAKSRRALSRMHKKRLLPLWETDRSARC